MLLLDRHFQRYDEAEPRLKRAVQLIDEGLVQPADSREREADDLP